MFRLFSDGCVVTQLPMDISFNISVTFFVVSIIINVLSFYASPLVDSCSVLLLSVVSFSSSSSYLSRFSATVSGRSVIHPILPVTVNSANWLPKLTSVCNRTNSTIPIKVFTKTFSTAKISKVVKISSKWNVTLRITHTHFARSLLVTVSALQVAFGSILSFLSSFTAIRSGTDRTFHSARQSGPYI